MIDSAVSFLPFLFGAIIGFLITPKGLGTKFIGEILVYTDHNGKRFRVLKRPKESETDAILRLRQKANKHMGAK